MKSNVRNLKALNTKINALNKRKQRLTDQRKKQRATLRKTENKLNTVKAQYGEIAELKLEIISRALEPSTPLIDMTSEELDKWLKQLVNKLKSADENSKLLAEREKQITVLMQEIKTGKPFKTTAKNITKK